jgi:DNA-directed RNA polymerase specialized sigma24 family protein
MTRSPANDGVAVGISGERADWRTPRHLKRAAIAAFRHEALAHWKAVNAQKRRSDRDAAPFDPERDGPTDDPLNRLYEPDPREELVARDWLVQLRGDVREFWKPVILEGVEYKEAGDRLGLNQAERQAMYRQGIEHLGRFRRLLDEGRVCQLRAPAIAASVPALACIGTTLVRSSEGRSTRLSRS